MTRVRRLSPNGDMTFGQGLANMATAAEACAQNVRTRLLMIEEEWFLDLDAGVPYRQGVFVNPPQFRLVESTLKATILGTIDVAGIDEFSLDLNHRTRQLTVNAVVRNIYGSILNIVVTL